MDKELFHNEYLAVIDRDGYVFSREVRCNGVIVALLPFRASNDHFEFLARLEICPAHGPEPKLCSITGGVEPGVSVEETVQHELWEEAGYHVNIDELIGLGVAWPSKSADTIAHLFAIDVTSKSPSTPPGDGTQFEVNSSVKWVDYEQGVQTTDPLFVIAIARLEKLYLPKK